MSASEIKFRAWDKANNKWLSDDFVKQLFLAMNGKLYWFSHAGIDEVTGLFDVVFYIGLKDKYETEAYQGDIVKDPFSGMTWLISYHENGRWYLETIRSDCEHWAAIDIIHIADFEIIGNEFQNPEILESA